MHVMSRFNKHGFNWVHGDKSVYWNVYPSIIGLWVVRGTQIICTLFHSTSLPWSSSNFQPWKDSDNLPNHPPLLSWRTNYLEPQKEEHHFNLFTPKFLRLSKLHSLDIPSIAPSFILKILSFLFFDSYSFGLAASYPKKRCGLSGERKSL